MAPKPLKDSRGEVGINSPSSPTVAAAGIWTGDHKVPLPTKPIPKELPGNCCFQVFGPKTNPSSPNLPWEQPGSIPTLISPHLSFLHLSRLPLLRINMLESFGHWLRMTLVVSPSSTSSSRHLGYTVGFKIPGLSGVVTPEASAPCV